MHDMTIFRNATLCTIITEQFMWDYILLQYRSLGLSIDDVYDIYKITIAALFVV